MSQISVEEVARLAKLAHIELNEGEEKLFAEEVSAILERVDELNNVQGLEGVEPTSQVSGLMNVTRDDEIIDYGIAQEELLQNANATQDGSIKVERVL